MKKLMNTLICLFLFVNVFAKEIIVIDTTKTISEKKALVILNGFGDSKKNRKVQKKFFQNKGYDLFIPKYVKRKSLKLTQQTFTNFYYSNNLDSYKEVNFLCYIVGGLVLNKHIEKNGKGKIIKIIYDRSPIQERAAKVATNKLPIISRIMYGKVLSDFSKEKLVSLTNDKDLDIGLIIENKATRLMRFFEKSAAKYGEYNFNATQIESNYDDFIHTILDHDMMYTRFDIIGDEIFYFLQNSKFPVNSRREKYHLNPFEKIKIDDINL